MDPKHNRPAKKIPFKTPTHSSAGLFLLAAAAWGLSSRSVGQQLIALGEGVERLFCTAKSKLEGPTASVQQKKVKSAPKKAEETPVHPAPVTVKAEETPALPDFTTNESLELVDVQDQPDVYAAMLARRQAGEVELLTRYRRSYESRLIQSKDPMQEYYSGIKNALLHYKGVKSRISWANETFHQGRNHIAKIIVKTSCLYIYLAIDPDLLKGTKFESAIGNASDKKKFGTLPTVIKMKGERKYKYALELIDRICAEDLALPLNKKFVETDYKRPSQTDEQLVQAGLIKMLVAEVKKTGSAE